MGRLPSSRLTRRASARASASVRRVPSCSTGELATQSSTHPRYCSALTSTSPGGVGAADGARTPLATTLARRPFAFGAGAGAAGLEVP